MARARSGYRPAAPFAVPMVLMVPTVTNVRGARVKDYPAPIVGASLLMEDGTALLTEDGDTILLDNKRLRLFFGSFRTFGGTERMANEVYTIEDTATVDTWYDPIFTADCRVYVCATGKTYDVIGTPENIEMRNQYTEMKLRAIGGGA